MRSRALAALLVLAAAVPAAAQDGRIQRGRSFVESRCSECHAAGPTGDSPLAKAPAFRTLRERYPIEDLAESLAEGIATGQKPSASPRSVAVRIRPIASFALPRCRQPQMMKKSAAVRMNFL